MSLSITEKEDLFRYIDASLDLNQDASIYALSAKIYILICEYCRDNSINIFLSDINRIGFEYLIEYQNKRNKNDEYK